ncbi:MAG: hypothetical protein L0H61_06120 [Micrococcaceae bacterium]|nr:hypothetical protein [Micrococcaceae bacterium]MDN5886583.1 hypothetical protein [Micrococcaceae bacterium]
MPTDLSDNVFSLSTRSPGPRRGPGPQRRRHRGLRAFMAIVLGVGVVSGGVYAASRFLDHQETLVRPHCTAAVGPDQHRLAPEQASNAALISAVAVRRNMPARAATIGIATSVQESKLRNIDYGDRAGPDSRGLFQQRPSQGWGTEKEIMDPLYATNRFYQELETFDYRSLPVTEAAQKVQRSAFPEAYAAHEPEGRAYASALTGHSPAALNCVLRRPTAAGDVAATSAQLTAAFGDLPVSAGAHRLTVSAADERGWAVAQWAVANAAEHQIVSVSNSGLLWNRAEHQWVPGTTAKSQVVITFADAAP